MVKKLLKLLRELTYDTSTVKLYLLLALVNIFLVIIAGIVYGVNLYAAKVKYLTSLETQRAVMVQKDEQLKSLKSSYDTANLFVEKFNRIMPTTVDFENYVVPFSNTLAENGFLVTGMNPSIGSGEGIAVINVRTEGDYTTVSTMLKAIEKMQRITDVESIIINRGSLSIPMSLRVYFVPERDL